MATVKICFAGAMGAGAPVFAPIVSTAVSITSSGTSQATTIAALGGDYAHVTASGGAVHVHIGQTPVAIATDGYMVTDGETKSFGPLTLGDKVAILDI